MWLILLLVVVLVYCICCICRLEKRVSVIEEKTGLDYSQRFSVNVLNAVLKYKKFGEMVGIKSIVDGKEYKDWSKVDKNKWQEKIARKIIDKTWVVFDYLQFDNTYFIRNKKDNLFLVQRDGNKKLLYSEIIAGDKDGIGENISFVIYERTIGSDTDGFDRVLTPCLEYESKNLLDGKSDFVILCDFPLFKTNLKDKEIEKFGFEVNRRGGDDVYEDSFGEMCSVPMEIKYKKNGVEIEYIF